MDTIESNLSSRPELTFDTKRLQLDGQRIPIALIEWISAMDRLDRGTHGFTPADIVRPKRFWHHAEIGFSCAGFVLLLRDGRRMYLQCAFDEDAPEIADVNVEPLAPAETGPAFHNACEPLGGWLEEVAPFNRDLMRLRG